MMPKIIDLTGHKYGLLTVIGPGKSPKKHARAWVCVCDCGNDKTAPVTTSDLRSGNTRSCGCLQEHQRRKGFNKSHGNSSHPLYGVWKSMIGRCNNPAFSSYKIYGARGIKVCKRWHDFSAFIEDMPEKPTPKHSLERVDNSAGYEPGNVIWATRYEQVRNTRRNVFLELDGERLCLKDWASRAGISPTAFKARVKKHGLRKALWMKKKTAEVIFFDGKKLTIKEWASALGIHHSVLRKRIERWPLKRALTTIKPNLKAR
jgi:hypothetical protein